MQVQNLCSMVLLPLLNYQHDVGAKSALLPEYLQSAVIIRFQLDALIAISS